MNKPTTNLCAKLILAFFVLYVLWGANYLAIFFAVESIPPFILGGSRFLVAGLLIYAWCRIKGERLPRIRQWTPAIKLGLMLNVIGTGALIWSEQYIPSGFASMIITTVPLWMVIMDKNNWPLYHMKKSVTIGLVLGFLGVLLLTGSQEYSHNNITGEFYTGIIVLVVGTISWAGGSLYARRVNTSASLLMNLAMQMISASIILLIISILWGEWPSFSIQDITLRAGLAFVHIVLFGSVAGYIAYLWLLKVKPPAIVGTYAYVNPVIAVLLGWLLAHEPMGMQTIVSLCVILLGVFLVSFPTLPNLFKRYLEKYVWSYYKRKNIMIARTWHGVVPREKGDAYYQYLIETGLSEYSSIHGNKGIQVLRRDENDLTHFFLITFWESLEAIKMFAGENYEKARYFSEDENFLLEMEPCANHYEVLINS